MMGDSLRVSVRIKEEICSAVVVPDFLFLIINISVHHHGRGDDPAGHHHDVPAAQDGVHPDPPPGGGALAGAAPPRGPILGWKVSLCLLCAPVRVSTVFLFDRFDQLQILSPITCGRLHATENESKNSLSFST